MPILHSHPEASKSFQNSILVSLKDSLQKASEEKIQGS